MFGLKIIVYLCMLLFVITGCNQNHGGVSSKQAESATEMKPPDTATTSAFTYEPTNGTTSNGVYRIK